ncbi:MAG TPA: nuclear transport factor 2 family protein [Bacteroidales bacterium]|nr:nuclear transport factor 2 family protein [Bacteroidales bacterium]
MKKISILTTIVYIVLSGCSREQSVTSGYDPGKDKELIVKTINSSIGWAKNKDIELLHSIISNDSSFLEVHPDGRVVTGFSEFIKAEKFWMSEDFQAVRYEIRDLQVNISQIGNVAWWFCLLDDVNTWKGEQASWENTRWTGVMEKRNNKWIIVQQHFSFADN